MSQRELRQMENTEVKEWLRALATSRERQAELHAKVTGAPGAQRRVLDSCFFVAREFLERTKRPERPLSPPQMQKAQTLKRYHNDRYNTI